MGKYAEWKRMVFPLNIIKHFVTSVTSRSGAMTATGGIGNEGVEMVEWIQERIDEHDIVLTGATGSNLTVGNRTTTTLDIISDTGSDATVPAATTSLAGLLTAADKTKLDGLASSATNLSIGTQTQTTTDINSDTGTDATIPEATPSNFAGVGGLSGLLGARAKFKLNQAITKIDWTAPAGIGVGESISSTDTSRVVGYSSNTGDFGLLGAVGSNNAGSNNIGLLPLSVLSTLLPSGGGSADVAYEVTITGGTSGSKLQVLASATGITASYASNQLTITIPAGKLLKTAFYTGVFADVQSSADAGGVTNWMKFKFDGTPGNTGLTDMRIPEIQKTVFASGVPSITNPYTITQSNNPATAVVLVGSNSVTMRVSSMSGFTNGFQLTFTGF